VKYDFDTVIDRSGTGSAKYNLNIHPELPKDAIPLWVADMDFQAPPEIAEAIKSRADHHIYGYTYAQDSYFETLKTWFAKRHGWAIEPEWLTRTSGVVNAINIAVRSLSEEGDAVIIQPPVYHPFEASVTNSNRKLVQSELVYDNGSYNIDFDDFEQKVRENNVKLFILCSPHNPVSRVWSRDELEKLGDICVQYGVTVIADEIHEDFIYPGFTHVVFADIKPEFKQISVTCTAPSKTFNLAGLQTSNIFIPDEVKRKKFNDFIATYRYTTPGLFGLVACQAAYGKGEEWLEQLVAYLWENAALVDQFIKSEIPDLTLSPVQGTYLLWLNFNKLGLAGEGLDDFIKQKAHLWLNSGYSFGQGGDGFQRVNIAAPRSLLTEALDRLKSAVREYSPALVK
jgi:cystathionine beta-lyase